jgi:myo-inositol-1(or 4)-monophosphatase
MPEIDISQVEELAREAGEIALRQFRNVKPERKANLTMVTAADRQMEEFLRQELAAAFPGYPVVGEEFGGFEAARQHPFAWAVDPIDGTVAFVKGLPVWAVSIGLLENGYPVAGVIYVPFIDEMYSVSPGGPARFNGERMTMEHSTEVDSDDYLCVPSNVHRRFRVRFSAKIRSLGSTAAHIALAARGSAWGTLLGRVSIWDIAAGAAIVAASGGTLSYLGGKEVDFPSLLDGGPLPDFVLVGTPARIRMMRTWIEVVPAEK